MAQIVLKNVTKHWGSFYAVDNMSLNIGDNDFITLLGPSGCGKTTTLRMIAGLETPTSGRIEIDGEVVFDSELGINIPANKRNVGFLFQNYALWPNMTVYQNIAFGLSNIKKEMPIYDYEAKSLKKIVDILENAEDLYLVFEQSKDKHQKIDNKALLIRLIDKYEISKYTAEQLITLNAKDKNTFINEADSKLSTYKNKLEAKLNKIKKDGLTLDDDYALVKDGKVQTKVRKLEKEEIDLAVRRVSRIVKIGMFMDRYPSELSGGQQQRVAIARTLAPKPKVLFMDEPLSNLDAKLRLEMRSELQRLHVETGSTFIYVTHDQLEAMTLATKICLMDNGVVQQFAAPLDLYNKPNNLFSADFVGNPSINFIDAKYISHDTKGFDIEILNGVPARFEARENIDFDSFKKDAEKEHNETLELEKLKKVEKANKIGSFKYETPMTNDQFIAAKKEVDENDLVIGVRPEFVDAESESGIDSTVFSSMPTGMETTLRINARDYLLTSVSFGDKLFKLDQNLKLNFKSNHIMIFHKKSNKLIALGRLILK